MSDLREEEIERGTQALLTAASLLVPLAVTYRLCNGRMWLAVPAAAGLWLALRSVFRMLSTASEKRRAQQLAEAKERQAKKSKEAS